MHGSTRLDIAMSVQNLSRRFCLACQTGTLFQFNKCTVCGYLEPQHEKQRTKIFFFVTRDQDDQARFGWGRKEATNVFEYEQDAINQSVKWQSLHPEFRYTVYRVEQLGHTELGSAAWKSFK